MLLILIAFLAGASLGFILGAFVVWRVLRRRPTRRPRLRPFVRQSSDFQPDDYIDHAAQEWADAHGVAAAGPLVARKLRLLQGIEQRRARRSRGWWS